jgi:hypothetical protein
MELGELQSLLTNSLFQHAGEQKKREDKDACESYAMAAFQRLGQKGRRHTDVTGRGPTVAHAFAKDAGQLANVGVRVGIAAAAADHQEQRVLSCNITLSPLGRGQGIPFRFFQPHSTQLNNVGVQMQMSAVVKSDFWIPLPRFVDFAGDIVLGVTGRHQHAGQHGNGPRSTFNAALDPLRDDWLSKLQETALDNTLRLMRPKDVHEAQKLLRSFAIPAAVSDEENCWLHERSLYLEHPKQSTTDFTENTDKNNMDFREQAFCSSTVEQCFFISGISAIRG